MVVFALDVDMFDRREGAHVPIQECHADKKVPAILMDSLMAKSTIATVGKAIAECGITADQRSATSRPPLLCAIFPTTISLW